MRVSCSRIPGWATTTRTAAILVALLMTSAAVQANAQPPGSHSPSIDSVLHLQLAQEQLPEYGPSFQSLQVLVSPETAARLHVKVVPSNTPRWEVPEHIIPRPKPGQDGDSSSGDGGSGSGGGDGSSSSGSSSSSSQQRLYDVLQPLPQPGQPFALQVARKATGQTIFDSSGHRFVYKPQYIEFSTTVPADSDLYGLGEVVLPSGLLLPRDGHTITLFNRDMASAVPDANLYGSHPFLLQVSKDGFSHGVFFLNSNGMDVVLNKTSVTFKVIGGVLDLYFFLGPFPEAVVRQYQEVIGRPAMPPYWALGVHQGRWGYKDVSALHQVVSNYSSAGIPLDCLWLDIEYMGNSFRTLTFDQERFPVPKMRAFVEQLHAAGQHWVPIHDAAIARQPGYKAYVEGSRMGVWIREAAGDRPYVGQVWPGEAVYPDYLAAPNVTTWLTHQLQHFHDQVPFDGLWLDMNEPANFCSGVSCRADTANKTRMHWLQAATPNDYNLSGLIKPRTSCQMVCDQEPLDNTLAHPPYHIHNFAGWDKDGNKLTAAALNRQTISPTAVHADGSTEYDAHNLFGVSMALRSHKAAEQVMGRRPFLLLRSTFPGAGRYAGHWTGDNGANWQSLADSIPSILAANLWGIPMSGADICGFVDLGEISSKLRGVDPVDRKLSDGEYQQLCNRWTSAGAFYPFVRNHYSYDTRSHEPYRWPDVAAAARKAYGMRYRLLTYLYSSMHLVHSRGGTLAKPVFFTAPADVDARRVQQQWMLGEALLVSPVLAHNSDEVVAQFTPGTWYNAWDYSRLDSPSTTHKLRVPLGDVGLHIRGGTVVPMQLRPANVSRDVRTLPVTLVAALPSAASHDSIVVPYALDAACARVRQRGMLVACGYLFMDSGEELAVTRNNSLQVWLTAVAGPDGASGVLSNKVMSNTGEARDKMYIEAVHVLGTPAPQGNQTFTVMVNGRRAEGLEARSGVLRVVGLRLLVGQPFALSWRLGGDAIRRPGVSMSGSGQEHVRV